MDNYNIKERKEKLRGEYKELGLRLGAMRAKLEQWKMQIADAKKKR